MSETSPIPQTQPTDAAADGGVAGAIRQPAPGMWGHLLGTGNLYILLVLLGLLALFSLISPGHAFFGAGNFLNIVWDSAETLLLAIGETFVIITANGFGDLISSAGAAGQNAIPPVPDAFANSAGSQNLLLGLPTLVIVSAVAAGLAHVALTRTLFGRRTFAVGSNLEGARLAGVPVNRHLLWVYVFGGFMSGLAGVLDLARFHTIDIQGHSLDNLNAIAAVVIGGTSLFGGTGSIAGTVIGAFIPTVLRYGFTIQGVSSFWQDVVVGFIIVVAVFIDQIRRRRIT